MADIVKTTKQLKLLMGFADGDDRTISIDNPRNDLTAAQIKEMNALMTGVMIGDKYGAAFMELKDANIVESVVTTLDLET